MMRIYTITVTVEAPTLADAINRVMYPDGEPAEGVIEITARESS